jgi:hypothetical protein
VFKGTLYINLFGTGFKFDKKVNWIANGTNAISKITKSDDDLRAYGICGGYCGFCHPDHKIGLKLQLL